MSSELVFVVSYGLLILMKIVCFILGYLIVRLGYRLIHSGVKGEFKFSGSLGGLKADLASVSPGLLFVTLGVFLIGYAIYVDKEIQTTRTEKTKLPALDLPLPPKGSPFVHTEQMNEKEGNGEHAHEDK